MELVVGVVLLVVGLVLALWVFNLTVMVGVYLVAGLFVGALARALLPGEQQMGLLATAVLGSAGSLLGGGLANHLLGFGWVGQLLASVATAAFIIGGTVQTRGR